MLITCLTCKINVNLVPLDERDINIVDYLFHPHSTPYLEQLKSNEATRICTSCQENIRDIDKFRNSALKNFLQLMQVLEIKPILRTCLAQSTSQQDTLAEIQSPSLDSTVLVKTERSELDAEELHIKPDLEDGIDEEQPQSDLSRMMLDNILQGMYVAKTTPTVINVTEEAVSNPASQSSQHDQVEDKSVATQPAIDIVKAERTTTSPGNKSISGKKKTSDLMYRKGFDVQRHRDEQNVKFKCSECSKTFRKKKVTACNHKMAEQPDEPMHLTDLPLPSRSNVLTSATPFAEPPTTAAPKSKAQKQREYRQRMAASRTPAQAIAVRKSAAERQRICRLRKAANSGTLHHYSRAKQAKHSVSQ